jgi:hypothetical protein
MKAWLRTEGTRTSFIISGLDPAYAEVLRALEYDEIEAGFAKTYPADTPHLASIFEQFSHCAEEMILQAADVHPVPWEETLLAFLQRTERQQVNWWLVGSAALAVRGLKIVPHDIDLCVDDASAHTLGVLLGDCLIEPVQEVRGWICNWFGRAFLHGRIEWVGGVDEHLDEDEVTDYGPIAASRKETITWHGYEIQVPPLDLQLQVSERRGLTSRVEQIKRALV